VFNALGALSWAKFGRKLIAQTGDCLCGCLAAASFALLALGAPSLAKNLPSFSLLTRSQLLARKTLTVAPRRPEGQHWGLQKSAVN